MDLKPGERQLYLLIFERCFGQRNIVSNSARSASNCLLASIARTRTVCWLKAK